MEIQKVKQKYISWSIGLSLLLILLVLGGGNVSASDNESKTLKIATANEIKSPSFLGDYNFELFQTISNSALLQMDENGNIIANLAKSWFASPDHTEWTFVIDDKYQWSDGTPLTPEDVAFTINYRGQLASSGWIGDTLVDTTTTDDSVTFIFNKPYSRLDFEFLSYSTIPKHIWESVSDPEAKTSNGPYVGCGQYYIKSVDVNSATLILEKNPYWKGEEPYYDTIEIHWFSNDNASSFALEKGEVDTYWRYASTYPYAAVSVLEQNNRFDIFQAPSIGFSFLGFNLLKGVGADLEFRKAVSSAINYEELMQITTLGYGSIPTKGFVPPSMPYYQEMPSLIYDPQAAEDILTAAGYIDSDKNGIRETPDGEELLVNLVIRQEYSREGKLVAEYLRDVGIQVNLKVVEVNTWYDLKDNYQYDLTITRTTPWGMLMHANWGTGYFDSRRTGQGVLHTDDNPAYLELCDAILATTDTNLLEMYAQEIQEYYAEYLPGVALYWKQDITPTNKDITGWYSTPFKGILNEISFMRIHPKT
ncbi:MAG: ABC transporter substrate-binding protein [Methanomicrobiales archaeon]|jgi:peptide/nickel transport system substrate-binding protein|nr:ABC transporter substrate-binding protein [Methanomicrobiales archaeon]